MRLKVPFFGYLLAIVGLILPSVIFVAMLPSLINAEPVKARLLKELKDWTGADVKVDGPIAIESFFSLSVDLRDVEFGNIEGASNITGMKVGRIVARIAWTDLLVGNLDFDKIRLFDAVIHTRAASAEELGETLLAALGGTHHNPFDVFGLNDSVVMIGADAAERGRVLTIDSALASLRAPNGQLDLTGTVGWRGERVHFEIATNLADLARRNAPVPLHLTVQSRLANGGFNGEASLTQAWSASGHLGFTTTDLPALSQWLGYGADADMPADIQLTGRLMASRNSIALQSAAFAGGGQRASGDLVLRTTGKTPRLQGALAFDELDLGRFWDTALGEGEAAPAPDAPRMLTATDMDLRISAERLRWRTLTATPAAFTFTAQGGRFSAEIAELGLFDGSLLGHVEIDLGRQPVRAMARVTAQNIDAALLSERVSPRPLLAGRADARIEVQSLGRGDAQMVQSLSGRIRLSFASGGSMPLDIVRLANASSAQAVSGWTGHGWSTAIFDEMRADLTLSGGEMRCDSFSLRSGGEVISGAGSVDLARQELDWQFTVRRASGESGPRSIATTGSVTSPPEAKLSIQGPWMRPVIRAGQRSGRLDEPASLNGPRKIAADLDAVPAISR